MRWAIAIAALRGVRRLAPEQVRPELRRAIEELRAAAVDAAERRRARRTLHRARGVRLNLGSGGRSRPGWMNLDLDRGGDLRLDLRRPLPLPDVSCAEIYSEHVLEHLAYPGEVEAVLRDWFRVLAPGGGLSLGVPDTEWPLVAYVNGNGEYFDWCRRQPWCPPWIETRLDQINFHFRQQIPEFGAAHRYAYDFETLAARLETAGFTDVVRRAFDPASDAEERRVGTLYVRATRP